MVDEQNLDKIRDEKCFPVAYVMLKEMATSLLGKDDDQKGLTESFLSLMVESDMNVTQEAGYVPQLILGTLSGLNLVTQSCTVIENDKERYTRIGSKILMILSEANIKLDPAKEEISEVFEVLKEPLNALFTEEKVTRLELKHIMDSIFEAYTALNNLTSKSITEATERMECKILGIDSMSDLTLKKVDDVLLTPKV